MNSILQDLYNGNLCPREDSGHSILSVYQDDFQKALKAAAPELEPKFDAFMTELQYARLTETEDMFYTGFGLAVRLFTEALSC